MHQSVKELENLQKSSKARVAWKNYDFSLMPGDSIVVKEKTATVLVSGIYELEPLIHTSINDALQMSKDSAIILSPLFKSLKFFPQTLITWGENETDEFKYQSEAFAQNLMDYGILVETCEVIGKNHFDIILDLANKNGTLGKKFYKLIEDVCS